jgi:hypothetical protein
MSKSANENILFPSEPSVMDREEVTAGMGLITAGFLDKIMSKAEELGARDDEVTQSAERFAQRMLILGNGLRLKPKRTKLYGFNERLKDSYELGTDAIDSFVQDKYRLLSMVDRIGMDIQGNMIVNGLLSEKAKRQLAELDSAAAGTD